MIYINNVQLKYGDRQLLKDVSFMFNKKERTGLIGSNGAGKSTLFKIISGQLTPDEGQVQKPTNFTVGYLLQDLNFKPGVTVMEETKSAFAQVEALNKRLNEVTRLLSNRTDYESPAYMALVEDMTDLNHRLDILGVGSIEAECEKILKGLGFEDGDMDKAVETFSGGWQMRIELAKLLLTKPDLLMLDEPTNHLDIESIIWLENYLRNYEGIVLVISHDIMFLNNVCTRIIELELGRATTYAGNYSKYLVQKEQQKEILLSAYANQQKDLAQKERTITRFMAKASKTSMAQSMQKQLDKIERIEIPEEDTAKFKLNFGTAPRAGRVVVDILAAGKSYGDKKVLHDVSIHVERGDKIAFVGQNGQGKTTLAKMIVGQLPPTSGALKMGTNVHIAYYAQNQSELLNSNITVLEHMENISPAEQRSNIRNILGAFLFSGEDAEKKISVLSGGERARLAIAAMILEPSNLLIMDEPTNHLDIKSKNVLKEALNGYDGTLIVVSHDREFLAGLTNKVYEFANHKIKEYLGDIEYFLQKKQMDDMRQVELTKATPATILTEERTIDWDEQKKMKRRVQYLERDINKLEEDMKAIESRMADPEFYKHPDFEKENARYLSFKSSLEKCMEEWEHLADQIVEV